MAKRLVLLTSDHGVVGSNPARGEILLEPNIYTLYRFCSLFEKFRSKSCKISGKEKLLNDMFGLSYSALIERYVGY